MVAAALLALVGGGAAAAAVPGTTSAPRSGVGAPVQQRATVISLAASAPDVKPHTATVLTATVLPRTAHRAVTVKMVVGGRFVGVARGLTDHAGVATIRLSFPRTGPLDLRAFVASTPHFGAAVSARVVETVTETLPIVLPSSLQLSLGSTGPLVLQVQQRLSALGYWLGTPDGSFADSTQQAVYALQKAAGITASGVVDQATITAINDGVVPKPRSTSGTLIEVDLQRDLVMFVHDGKLFATLNTSTGGGYTYVENGATDVATTPTGVFQMQRATDGLVVDSLGSLWRPRFFYEGFAIHGDSYVPSVPVSHGCVRVSNEAIDWIWAENLAPLGIEVWVY